MTTADSLEIEDRGSKPIYDRTFWLCYIANLALVAANALTFRFAELVNYLGGTERFTGTVVSVGLIAGLLVRFRLGQDIDGCGTRRLWISSSVLFVIGCCLFMLSDRLSWEMFAARIAFAVGLAGMFTCSIVYIQNHVPPQHRTEVLGNLGSSGFVGMVAGALLGDLIFHLVPNGMPRFYALFGGATVLGLFYTAVIVFLTRRDVHRRPAETPPFHQLVVRYWPGTVVLVAIMMGVGFAVVTVFLTRFATERGLNGIGPFFFGYAVSAFLFRIATRRWSYTLGRHRMIMMGLAGHCIGHMMLPLVTSNWHFLAPSIACGFGHALLFPAVVSLGAGSFPKEYRGTGTNVILGFTDVGQILFAPLLGMLIDQFGFPSMFFTSGTIALLIACIYFFSTAGQVDADMRPESEKTIAEPRAIGASARDELEFPAEAERPQVGPVAVSVMQRNDDGE